MSHHLAASQTVRGSVSNLISSVYQPLEPSRMRRVKKPRDRYLQYIARRSAHLAERERILLLVRANGFAGCSRTAHIAAMRTYLRERKIQF